MAEHLTPILYALEVCVVSMEQAGREEEVAYYRSLAILLADVSGQAPESDAE